MTEPIIRSIAADASVISIALLGVTFVLIALAWKGFDLRFRTLTRAERRELIKRCYILIIPILIMVGIVTFVGVNEPTLVQITYFLVIMGLGAISMLYLLITGIRRLIYYILRKRKQSTIIKLDESATLYFISLLFLVISLLCSIWALFGIIPTAMDISFDPNKLDNFNLSRWLLIDGVLFFTSGIVGTGISYLVDTSRKWKTESEAGGL